MVALIALLSKKDQNVAETAFNMLKAFKIRNPEAYGIASPTRIEIEKSAETLRKQNVNSPIVIGCVFSRIFPQDRPQPLKLENAAFVFDGRMYRSNTKTADAEVAAHELQTNREESAKALVKRAEGDFAFIIAEVEKLLAGRDAMGVRPLYFGENTDSIALASQREALWKIGIEKVRSFPPGHVALVDKQGLKFTLVRKLTYSKPRRTTMQAASKKLQRLLEQSVRERVSGLKEVAAAFSGGLDSSIIALLARSSGVDVHLVHASLEDRSETEHAKRVAEELKLPIHSYSYNEERLRETIGKVLRLIEEPDYLKVSIGIPLYWAAEKTAEMNLKVMLAGQGADELFGGYRRYVDEYLRHGNQQAQRTIFEDIAGMHETNIERDFKICNFHNVELRLPFATYHIARFATSLPLELKLQPSSNTLRKLVLRQVATNLGLPQSVVDKPKKAIQYTTGTSKVLNKIAKQQGLSVNEYLRRTFRAAFEKDDFH
jgi:asparagine synthase (glutamine-hydrolysing)